MSEVHVGDIGTKLMITFLKDGEPVDISLCTLKEILIEKPDATILTKTAIFETDGTDGKIFWLTTISTDFDLPGQWKVQGKISIGGGTWRTQVGVFRVYDNIV